MCVREPAPKATRPPPAIDFNPSLTFEALSEGFSSHGRYSPHAAANVLPPCGLQPRPPMAARLRHSNAFCCTNVLRNLRDGVVQRLSPGACCLGCCVIKGMAACEVVAGDEENTLLWMFPVLHLVVKNNRASSLQMIIQIVRVPFAARWLN